LFSPAGQKAGRIAQEEERRQGEPREQEQRASMSGEHGRIVAALLELGQSASCDGWTRRTLE
jgi:hypothetical protein